MKKVLKGRVHRLGHRISAEKIVPSRYRSASDPSKIVGHVLEGWRKDLAAKLRSGDIIVAGRSFGAGRRAWGAPKALKSAGVACIVAGSFGRCFFRESLNCGLVVVENEEAYEKIADGETIKIDLQTGEIDCKKGTLTFRPMPDFVMKMLSLGGLTPYAKELTRG